MSMADGGGDNSLDFYKINLDKDELDTSTERKRKQVRRNSKPSNNINCIWKQRILMDYKDFEKGEESPWGISAQVMEDDVSLWTVQILGPIGSLYEGGFFEGILQFSDNFPYHPPTFTFLTTVFHPNVSETGNVCLEQLFKMWSPCHTVWSFLVAIQFMLVDANDVDVLNPLAAMYYSTDYYQFGEIVREVVEASRNNLKNSKISVSVGDGNVNVQLFHVDAPSHDWKDRSHFRRLNSFIY